MGIIAGLKKTRLVYTTYVEGVESFVHRFDNVQGLRQYFHDHKREGEVVGYVVIKKRTPGFKDYILSGKLTVEWWDANGYASMDFDHVDKMVDFFHQEPMVGLLLKYEPKRI